MDTKEWAKLQESLLKSQLKTIRQFLRQGEEPRFKTQERSKSQMSVAYDILLSAKQPLHVTEIITRAKQDFHMKLDREILVSAINKKVKSGRMFKRVAPNTFTTLDSEAEPSSCTRQPLDRERRLEKEPRFLQFGQHHQETQPYSCSYQFPAQSPLPKASGLLVVGVHLPTSVY